MAGLTISVKGMDKVIKSIRSLGPDLQHTVQKEFKSAADDMVSLAKQKAPADEGEGGGIRSGINSRQVGGNYQVAMQKTHGIYQEFGTKGKFSAPSALGSYPSRFRGKGRGTYKEALANMIGWVHRKGIAGTYSVKTKRRTGSKASRPKQDRQVAYLILRKILKEGLRPQPYFFPAFFIVRKQLIGRMKQLLKDELRRR